MSTNADTSSSGPEVLDVVVLTCAEYVNLQLGDPTLDAYHKNVATEDLLVVDALKKVGLRARRVAWDDGTFQWDTITIRGGILIRTVWDYFHRYDEFSSWFERVTAAGVPFFNSAETIAWNIDKHYLEDLKDRKVNICPSTFVEKGVLAHTQTTLMKLVDENLPHLDEFVVKPCISGSARETYRLRRGEDRPDVEEVYAKLNEIEGFIVQPFQHRVVSEGEMSLMLFDGEVSHAVMKRAKEGDFRVQDDFGGTVHEHTPTDEEKQFAMQCALACDDIPLYARVDMFRDNDGKLALAELELIEPELWFRNCPSSADRLAECLCGRLTKLQAEKDDP